MALVNDGGTPGTDQDDERFAGVEVPDDVGVSFSSRPCAGILGNLEHLFYQAIVRSYVSSNGEAKRRLIAQVDVV